MMHLGAQRYLTKLGFQMRIFSLFNYELLTLKTWYPHVHLMPTPLFCKAHGPFRYYISFIDNNGDSTHHYPAAQRSLIPYASGSSGPSDPNTSANALWEMQDKCGRAMVDPQAVLSHQNIVSSSEHHREMCVFFSSSLLFLFLTPSSGSANWI